MKNFERLNKNEMKMVIGGNIPVDEMVDEGSCSTSLKCSGGKADISCTGEPGTCVVNSSEEWVSCDGAKTYCN
jgi:hypothetical protein